MAASRPETEVCIAGGGPAGLVLALLLGQAQIPCVVLERLAEEEYRRLGGAGQFEYRTVRLLDGHGLAEPIVAGGGRSGVCEFRFDGTSHTLDYASLAGGVEHYVHPQYELVAALADRLRTEGGEIRFGTRVTSVKQDEDGATVIAEADGEQQRLRCGFVAACDGARSVLSGAITGGSALQLQYSVRWLTVMAEAPPSKSRWLYGCHRRGMAVQARRGPDLTRYILEVPRDDTLADWPDERIWAELEERLHAEGEPELIRGVIPERDVLDLRVRVIEPMHDHRVFLVGDAAHLITPAGGKGMNLAIQDSVELAAGFRERYGDDPAGTRLAGYTATRLPAIWRAQQFSAWLLELIHADPAEFAYRLRRARLQELMTNPELGRWFARAYVGVDG